MYSIITRRTRLLYRVLVKGTRMFIALILKLGISRRMYLAR